MDEQRQDNQLDPTYNSSVLIENVALKTYWKRWTIKKGVGGGSGRSVLMAQVDDNDDPIYLAEEPSLPFYLPIAGGRIIGFIPFPKVLVLCEM